MNDILKAIDALRERERRPSPILTPVLVVHPALASDPDILPYLRGAGHNGADILVTGRIGQSAEVSRAMWEAIRTGTGIQQIAAWARDQ